jgi:two-component system response regulator CpxR
MTTKLLLVDDDVELCSMMSNVFQESGFSVDCESDSAAAITRVQTGTYGLMILDVMLPGLDGFEILRRIRARLPIPVLLLTARATRQDRVLGFRCGADDYLTKPFYPEELLARVQAILRRTVAQPSEPSDVLQAGELLLSPGSRNALYRGRKLDLTAMECEILEQLLRSAGRVVSRDELSLHLYNRVASPYDRTIDTHVSRIRRKLGEGRFLITSVRGTGYQLCRLPAPICENQS